MEKAQSILKSCDSLLSVTVSNLPPDGVMPDTKTTKQDGGFGEKMDITTAKECGKV